MTGPLAEAARLLRASHRPDCKHRHQVAVLVFRLRTADPGDTELLRAAASVLADQPAACGEVAA